MAVRRGLASVGRSPHLNDYSFALLLALFLLMGSLAFSALLGGLPSPTLFHNAAWCLTLLLYSSGWVRYADISTQAWVVMVGAILAFNIGAMIPYSRPVPPANRVMASHGFPGIQRAIPCLFAAGIVVYLTATAHAFGLHNLLHDPALIRSSQSSPAFLAFFPLPARLAYFLGPPVFVSRLFPDLFGTKRTRFRWLVVGGTALALAISLSRTLLFVALAWTAAIIYLGRGEGRPSSAARKPQRRMLPALVAAAAAIIGFQIIGTALGKNASVDPRIQAYVAGPLRGSSWTSLVVYATGGPPAFSRLMEGVESSHGAATLSPVAKLIPGVHPPPEVSPFADIPFPFNAYTWLEPFVRDFGPVGAIILPFATGLLLGGMVRTRGSSPELLLFGALLLGLSLWAPFVNKYTSTFTWEYAFLLWFAHRRADAPVRVPRLAAVR